MYKEIRSLVGAISIVSALTMMAVVLVINLVVDVGFENGGIAILNRGEFIRTLTLFFAGIVVGGLAPLIPGAVQRILQAKDAKRMREVAYPPSDNSHTPTPPLHTPDVNSLYRVRKRRPPSS